jgi:hypothetical protein
MKEKTRNLILKYAAAAGVFAFLYPFILVLRVLLFKNDGGASGFLFHTALVFSALLITGVIVGGKEILWHNAAAYALVVIPVAAAGFIYAGSGVWRMLFEMLAAFLMYFIGIRCSFLPFSDILSSNVIITGILLMSFSLIATFYFKQYEYLRGTITACTYTFIFITMIVKTQENLDSMFIRRHIESSSVPKNIRNFNNGLVILLFVSTVAIVNIRGALGAIATGMKKLLIGIVWLLIKILTLLFRTPENAGGSGQQQGAPKLPFSEENAQGSLITDIIMGIFMAAILFIILYILYPRIPYIAAAIVEKLRALFAAIVGWLRNLLRLPPPEPEVSEDYQDETEKLLHDKPDEKRKEQKKAARNIRKNLKRITDPAEKIRNLYCMVLLMLCSRGIIIAKADTTGEIYEKALSVEGLQGHMKKLTDAYDRVRYGERVPIADETKLVEQVYSKVDEVLRR